MPEWHKEKLTGGAGLSSANGIANGPGLRQKMPEGSALREAHPAAAKLPQPVGDNERSRPCHASTGKQHQAGTDLVRGYACGAEYRQHEHQGDRHGHQPEKHAPAPAQ